VIEVLRPGLLTTVQDLGRGGFQDQGVPVGGAADAVALRIANLLVGNPQGAAGLEMTLAGPRLRFARTALIALGGAGMTADLDGVPIPFWRPVRVTVITARRSRAIRSLLTVRVVTPPSCSAIFSRSSEQASNPSR